MLQHGRTLISLCWLKLVTKATCQIQVYKMSRTGDYMETEQISDGLDHEGWGNWQGATKGYRLSFVVVKMF